MELNELERAWTVLAKFSSSSLYSVDSLPLPRLLAILTSPPVISLHGPTDGGGDEATFLLLPKCLLIGYVDQPK